MQTDNSLGICTSTACLAAGNGPVQRYDGPGKYCPDCGEYLQSYVPGKSAWSLPGIPVPATTTVAPPASTPVPIPPKQPGAGNVRAPRRSRWRTPAVVLVLGGAGLTALALFALMSGRFAGAQTAGICGSSMTERFARSLLQGYTNANSSLSDRFSWRDTNCDVTFSIDLNDQRRRRRGFPKDSAVGNAVAGTAGVVGLDGIVAIVNPQNPIKSLRVDQLRKVLSGDVANWAAFGGRSEPIAVYLPERSTDEARILDERVMQGVAIGASAVRLPSSADAVRAVVAANGSDALGVVAFSSAVPAKVLALDNFPVPSTLTIASRAYPLSVPVTVVSAPPPRNEAIDGFLNYLGSDSAKEIAARTGIITNSAPR